MKAALSFKERETSDKKDELGEFCNPENIEKMLQERAVIIALHQSFTAVLDEAEEKLFETLLHGVFKETDVYKLLRDDTNIKESRSTGVKLALEEKENLELEDKGNLS